MHFNSLLNFSEIFESSTNPKQCIDSELVILGIRITCQTWGQCSAPGGSSPPPRWLLPAARPLGRSLHWPGSWSLTDPDTRRDASCGINYSAFLKTIIKCLHSSQHHCYLLNESLTRVVLMLSDLAGTGSAFWVWRRLWWTTSQCWIYMWYLVVIFNPPDRHIKCKFSNQRTRRRESLNPRLDNVTI